MPKAGVTHLDPNQKSVELRFGQPVNALLFDRVLSGHHHKRKLERKRVPIHRHLIFLHGFQERGLRFGRCPVDLIGQEDLCKDRPFPEYEIVCVPVEDRGSRHIGGQ